MKVLATYNIKGGVGKTSTIEVAMKATNFDNLDLPPADFSYRNMDLELDDTKKRTKRLRRLLDSVDGDYDVVFLDCPPSVSLVSENVLHASDTLLVPLIPALSIIEQMAERRAPVHDYAPTSRAGLCYERLWAEVRPWKNATVDHVESGSTSEK